VRSARLLDAGASVLRRLQQPDTGGTMGIRLRRRCPLVGQATSVIAHWLPLDGRQLAIMVLAPCATAIGAFTY